MSNYATILAVVSFKNSLRNTLEDTIVDHAKNQKILIDTVLYTGLNESRFLEAVVTENGHINLDSLTYVTVSDELTTQANKIIQRYQKEISRSVLTQKQQALFAVKPYR